MRRVLFFLSLSLAACSGRNNQSGSTGQMVQRTASSIKKEPFSRYQLTGPQIILTDTIPYNSDTVFSTSLRCISDTPLIIYKTDVSCTCTTSGLSTPDTLKKGESIKLPVRYNTKIRGPFAQSVLVFNNTEVNPLVISIRGVIR